MYENLNNTKFTGEFRAVDREKYPNTKSDYFVNIMIDGVEVPLSASAMIRNHPEYGKSLAVFINEKKTHEKASPSTNNPLDHSKLNETYAKVTNDAPNPDDIPF